jgi:hypothetical protein
VANTRIASDKVGATSKLRSSDEYILLVSYIDLAAFIKESDIAVEQAAPASMNLVLDNTLTLDKLKEALDTDFGSYSYLPSMSTKKFLDLGWNGLETVMRHLAKGILDDLLHPDLAELEDILATFAKLVPRKVRAMNTEVISCFLIKRGHIVIKL